MKKFIVVLITFFTCVFCNAQNEYQKPKTLKGTKKSITKNYIITDGKDILKRTHINTYDENVNRIGLEYFSSDSSEYRRFVYEFDSANNQTLIISYDINGNVMSRTEIKYDEQNRKVKTSSWNKSKNTPKYYHVKNKDQFAKMKMKTDSEAKESVNKFENDKLLHQTGETVNKYDNDKLIKQTIRTENETKEIVYQYDSKGRLISKLTYVNRKLIRKVLNEYEDY